MTYLVITSIGLGALLCVLFIVNKMAKFVEQECPKCGSVRIELEETWFCKGCGITDKSSV